MYYSSRNKIIIVSPNVNWLGMTTQCCVLLHVHVISSCSHLMMSSLRAGSSSSSDLCSAAGWSDDDDESDAALESHIIIARSLPDSGPSLGVNSGGITTLKRSESDN